MLEKISFLCGCCVEGVGESQVRRQILRCPLHAAAPDLLAACKELVGAREVVAIQPKQQHAAAAKWFIAWNALIAEIAKAERTVDAPTPN